jgi:hypothetical protein
MTRMVLKTLAAVFTVVLFVAPVKYPLLSRWSGGFADVTIAVSCQDMPSGIYYDREFDWPTGEALWIDLPAWLLYATLVCGAASCAVASCIRKGTPNQTLEATADAPVS